MAVPTNIDFVPAAVTYKRAGDQWNLPGVPNPTNAQIIAALADPARQGAGAGDGNQLQSSSNSTDLLEVSLAPQASIAGKILTRLDLFAYLEVGSAPSKSNALVSFYVPGASTQLGRVSLAGEVTSTPNWTAVGMWVGPVQITDLKVLADLVESGGINNLRASCVPSTPAGGTAAFDAIYARAVTVPGYELSGTVNPRVGVTPQESMVLGLQGTV